MPLKASALKLQIGTTEKSLSSYYITDHFRLHERGAAEMVLQVISASNGRLCEMVVASLDLGISLLQGGNEIVQRKMLCHLQEKHDTKFFTSLSSLMQLCNVLDLDAYERSIKAETLGSSQVQLEDAENKGKAIEIRVNPATKIIMEVKRIAILRSGRKYLCYSSV